MLLVEYCPPPLPRIEPRCSGSGKQVSALSNSNRALCKLDDGSTNIMTSSWPGWLRLGLGAGWCRRGGRRHEAAGQSKCEDVHHVPGVRWRRLRLVTKEAQVRRGLCEQAVLSEHAHAIPILTARHIEFLIKMYRSFSLMLCYNRCGSPCL